MRRYGNDYESTGWEPEDERPEPEADDVRADRLFKAEQAAYDATTHRKPVKPVNRPASGSKRCSLYSALCLVRARWLKG